MSPCKVIIAGGGIAGPVLAMLLKQKGYDPIIYERANQVTNMGLSLCLQPNGLRVLNLIPGLLDKVVRRLIQERAEYSVVPGDEGELSRFRLPLHDICGFGAEGVRRAVFHRTLVEAVQERGITIVFGHQLVDLEQHDESVTVTFANGKTADASFVVGCDGLHSNTRICLFGKEEAIFTGLTQTGGISPIPQLWSHSTPPMMNIYGDGIHMISYPVNESQVSWALTQREPEEKETWRDMDDERQAEFKAGPFSKLQYGGGELVCTADVIIKYGLYDRPELKTWHHGRVVLIGDAAHPTSPHLGQGANQAFEDTYHLVRLLLKHNPSADVPSTEVLSAAFAEFEQLRIPRTAELVAEARKVGESKRVVSGFEACKKRNDYIRVEGLEQNASGPAQSVEVLKVQLAEFLLHPFEDGKSEI